MSSNTAVVTGPIATGGWVNLTPADRSRSYSAWTSSTPNDVKGMPSSTSALFERPRGGMSVRFEQELGAVAIIGGYDSKPPMSTHRDFGLLDKSKHVCIKRQGLVLIVD